MTERIPSSLADRMTSFGDPVGYVRRVVDDKVDECLSPFVEPPKDARKAIKTGLWMLLNTVYASPDTMDIPDYVEFAHACENTVAIQANLRVDFTDVYRKTARPLQQDIKKDVEKCREFEDYLKQLMLG